MNKLLFLLTTGALLLGGCVHHNAATEDLLFKPQDLSKLDTRSNINELDVFTLKNQCVKMWLKREYKKFNDCYETFKTKNSIAVKPESTLLMNSLKADIEYRLRHLDQAIIYARTAEAEFINSIGETLTKQTLTLIPEIGLDQDYVISGAVPPPALTGFRAAIENNDLDTAKLFINAEYQFSRKWKDVTGGLTPGNNKNQSRIAKMEARLAYEQKKYKKTISILNGVAWNDADPRFTANLFHGLGKATDQLLLEAMAYFKLHEMDKAKKRFDSILEDNSRQQFFYASSHWSILFYRAQIHIAQNEPKLAINKLKMAVDIIESERSSINSDSSKINFVGDKQAVYALLIRTLMADGHYDEAFAYAERGKSRALVDMLASKEKFAGNDVGVAEQNKLLAQLDTAEAKASMVGASESGRSTTRSVAIKARSALAQQAPELSSLVTVEAPDVKEIQSLLPEGETLIEYYGSGDDLFAFVVTADGIRGVALDSKGLAGDVTAFRAAILNPKDKAYQQSGNKLYQHLIAPLVSGIHTRNLTIVPHGALHYLPFSALTTDHGFMLDKYNIRILPSASVMKFLKAHKNKAGSMLALGNPDLGEAKYDLPFAQKEAINVSNEVPGAKLLLRSAATETAIKEYGKGFRYLHFASHGTFDAEKPLQSGLLLAKDDKNDGMLTVGELYDLNLNADLVTLSACETALGKIANGDDVVGFTRGFLYAGASTIVSSLWQVDDAATSDLMTGFYAKLGKEDKRSALRDAQLATKAKYHHPYYWAAFQMTGAVH